MWPPRRFWCAGARFFAVPVVTGVMAVVEGTHDVGSSRMVDQVVIRAIARIFDGWQVWPKKSSLLRRAESGACASRLPAWLPRIARCAPSRNQPLAGARLRSRCVFETTLDGLDGAGQTPLKRTIMSCPSGYQRQRNDLCALCVICVQIAWFFDMQTKTICVLLFIGRNASEL